MRSITRQQWIRLVCGTGLNLCLLPLVMNLSKWSSLEREGYLAIIAGGVATAALVCVLPIFWRGKPWQVPIAFVLLWLPGFVVFHISSLVVNHRHCDLMSRHDVPSPDHKHVAVVLEMCCYDTTGYYPHVSLLRSGQKLGKTGNVLSGSVEDKLTAAWIDAKTLEVSFPARWDYKPPAQTNIGVVTIKFTERQ